MTAFSTFRDFQSLYVNIHQNKNLQNVLNFIVQDAATEFFLVLTSDVFKTYHWYWGQCSLFENLFFYRNLNNVNRSIQMCLFH